MEEESQDIVLEVPALESQDFFNGHHGEKRDNIGANKGISERARSDLIS
jgi:hypothetical protein